MPDAALQLVQLTCRPTDLPANGLDDDCDGAIDGAPTAASGLTIVTAYRTETAGEVRLALTSESGSPVPNQALEREAQRGPAVALSRLGLSDLPSGRYVVTASRAGGEVDPAELSLAVSLATVGPAQTYLVRLGAGETRTLGTIEVP